MPGEGEFARLKPVPLFALPPPPLLCYGSRCMNGVPPLEFAGVSHWAALAVLLAAGVCIMELGQSYKKTVRNRTTFWLGVACLFSLVPDLNPFAAGRRQKKPGPERHRLLQFFHSPFRAHATRDEFRFSTQPIKDSPRNRQKAQKRLLIRRILNAEEISDCGRSGHDLRGFSTRPPGAECRYAAGLPAVRIC